MDPPADTRNRLQWHQDSSYFRQNDHGAHGCVCSMPMIDLAEGHGPLEILPGSHQLGRIEVASSGQYSTITSEQFRIADSITQGFKTEKILINAGDALFFNFDLIHRSGFNASSAFRFTAITRYHRMLAHDFKVGRLVYRARARSTLSTDPILD
jgi:ectoine hydroxylase-related dioxygenase (phytanoyl-CoA dioxygenase family)